MLGQALFHSSTALTSSFPPKIAAATTAACGGAQFCKISATLARFVGRAVCLVYQPFFEMQQLTAMSRTEQGLGFPTISIGHNRYTPPVLNVRYEVNY